MGIFMTTFMAPMGPSLRCVGKTETWPPIQRAFYESCRAAGYADCPDLNGPEPGGVGPIPMNNPGGVRMSTALTISVRVAIA